MKGNLKVTLATLAFILTGAMALQGCNTVQGAAYGTGRAVESTARGVSADVHAVTGPRHHTKAYHHKGKTMSKTKVKHTAETTTTKTMDQSAPTSTQSSY